MTRYSIEPRTRKYLKGYRFLSFARNLSKKYKNQLLNTGIDSLKTAFKKLVHKTGEFLGNKTADTVVKLYNNKIVKTKPVIDENLRNVEEIVIPSEKKGRNIKQIKTSIIKMEHYKISTLLNNSTVSKFVRKNGLKEMI